MGCHNDGSPCGTGYFGISSNTTNPSHCDARRPGDGNAVRMIDVQVYPPLVTVSGLENPDADAVMYDSILYSPYPPTYRGGIDYTSPTDSTDTAAGECGKLSSLLSCGKVVFDYVPGGLSFREMDSDTWFGYLFDMGPRGGVVGTPCYRIETETRTGSTTSTPSGGTPSTSTDANSSKSRCIPCTEFYCTPTRSYCSYNYNGQDETGDPDCPYPLIFGVGTDSNKIVFRYNSLSTDIPDSVNDVNFVYAPDNIDVDVWNNNTYSAGDPVNTTQNPWKAGDEAFEDFVIVEGEDLEDGNKQGMRIKYRIAPIIDGAGEIVTFTGTQWEFLELINGGQNYAVNDTFTLSYTRNHTDGSSSTLTMDLKVTSIGPTTSVSAQEDFATLSEGDTINGHTVIATRHSDLDNFPYHIVYLDETGADFVKDTQYTSSRNHVITVVAGFGIVDRVYFGGYYEFFDKSVQYTIHNLDEASPDVFNAIRQPDLFANLSNGTLSSVTINDGGEGLNLLKGDPELVVTHPNVDSGTPAVVEGEYSNGVLTSVKIVNPGSGYTTSNRPQLWIRNVYREDEEVVFEGISQKDAVVDSFLEEVRNAGTFPEFSEIQSSDPGAVAGNTARQQGYETKTQGVLKSNRTVKQDFERNRKIELPQRLYRSSEVEELRSTYDGGDLFKYNLPDSSNISDEYRQQTAKSQVDNAATLNQSLDGLIQPNVPDSISYPENYVETTQRRFLDLPKASPLTKYTIKQYRPDPRESATLNITIGCDVLESGCGHMEEDPNPLNGGGPLCPGPLPTPNSSSTDETTDETTGDTTSTTVSYTYSLSPLMGPGCQSWSASGSMLVRHNMSRSTDTFASASAAYGNPFDL